MALVHCERALLCAATQRRLVSISRVIYAPDYTGHYGAGNCFVLAHGINRGLGSNSKRAALVHASTLASRLSRPLRAAQTLERHQDNFLGATVTLRNVSNTTLRSTRWLSRSACKQSIVAAICGHHPFSVRLARKVQAHRRVADAALANERHRKRL